MDNLLRKSTRVIAWGMTIATAVWTMSPTQLVSAATVYKYKWVSQTPATVTADGTAHYVTANQGQSVTMSVTLQNLSGTTIKGKTALGAIPAGKQVQVGAWGIGVKGDAQTSWADPSSFVLNGNRLAYYDGADVAPNANFTISWTLKIASTAPNGVYDFKYNLVSEYLAWTQQVAWNGKSLPINSSDIFTRVYVGTTPQVGGGNLNVSVAASTPASGNVAKGAVDVTMAQLTFGASASQNALVNSISIRRTNLSADDDASDIKIYDGATKLGSTQGLNTTTHKATFTGLSWLIPAGTSKTLTIKASVPASTADTGKILSFGIDSAADITLTGGGLVAGTFPAYGNSFTVGAISTGQLDVDVQGTPAAANVLSGSTDQAIASWKFTASSTEGFDVNSLTLREIGTSTDSDASNFKLKLNGVQIGSTVGTLSGSAVTFTGSPLFTVKAGQSEYVYIYCDVAANITSARTLRFELNDTVDIAARGQNSGSNATITYSSGTAFVAQQGSIMTIVQGTLTVTEDPTNLTAQTYIIGEPNAEVAKMKFSAGSREGMKVTKLIFNLDGTSTASNTDFQNAKLYVNDSATPIATGGSIGTSTITFEDGNGLFTVPISGNAVVALKVDISSSASNGETILIGLGTSSTNYTAVTAYGLSSGEKIPQDSDHITLTACSDGDAATHTISQYGTMVLSNGTNTPAAANYALGTTAYEFLQFRLAATSEAMRLTALTVRFYDDASASDAYSASDEAATGDVTNAKLYYLNGSTWTMLGSEIASPTTGVASFTFDHTVPKNITETFKVVADIPTTSAASYLYADVGATTGSTTGVTTAADITTTGVYSAANITETGTADGNLMTKAVPTLTPSMSTVPAARTVVVNSSNVLLARLFLTANDTENIRVSTLRLSADDAAISGNGNTSAADTNFSNIHLAVDANGDGDYVDAGDLTTINKPFTSGTPDYVSYSGSDFNQQWIVPKGGSLVVDVRGDAIGSSDNWSFGMVDDDPQTSLVASGVSSGTSATISGLTNAITSSVVTLTTGGTLTVTAATDTPTVQMVTASYNSTTNSPTFFRAKLVGANEDIKVDAIRAKVYDATNGSEDDNFAGPVKVYEGGTMVGNVLSGGTLVGSGTLMPVSSADAAADIVFTTPVTIPTGGTKYLTLVADLNSVLNGADSGDVPYLGIDSDNETGIWLTGGNTYNNKLNIRAKGLSSSTDITDANDAGATTPLTGNAVYVVKTKLGMAVNSASPSGTVTEQANHTIFKLNMTNSSTDTEARFRAGQSYDTADATGWSAIGGTTVAADSAAYITTGAAKFSEAELDAGDGMQQDAGNTTTLDDYTRVNFWIRVSATGVSAGDLHFYTDDTSGLGSPVGDVSIPAIAAATWYNVDSAITNTATRYFGVLHVVDVLSTESITIDRVVFYNDKLQMSLSSNAGLFNTASTPTTTPVVYLKDNASNTTIATGYYSGTGTAGLSTSVGRVIFIPTTEMAIPASGKVYDVVTDSDALMIVASKNLTISVDLGSASSAGAITNGDVMWNDNSASTTIGWVESTTSPLSRSLNF